MISDCTPSTVVFSHTLSSRSNRTSNTKTVFLFSSLLPRHNTENLCLNQLPQTTDGRANGSSSRLQVTSDQPQTSASTHSVKSVGSASNALLAGRALPDTNSLSLHAILSADCAGCQDCYTAR
eukprot:414602-Hanusia_phi.AAC.1